MSDPVGPGTELHRIFYELGIHPRRECECRKMMAQMNEWGVEGCKRERQVIVLWLEEQQRTRNWMQTLRDMVAGAAAVLTGKLPWVDPTKSIAPQLLDEAISRAETKERILAQSKGEPCT